MRVPCGPDAGRLRAPPPVLPVPSRAQEPPLRFLRQIVDDTSALIHDVRKGLAHLGWRLSWWRRKRHIRSEEDAAERENLRRGAAVKTKMCRECRALIPAGADQCPECGAPTAHIRSGGLERRVSAALPFTMNASMMLISAFFIMFILGMILSLTLEPRGPGDEATPFGVLMGLDTRALLMTGANEGTLSRGPEPWRLLTAIFLHGGLLHLAMNTLCMVWFTQLVERLYGPSRMFVLFIGAGVIGNVVSLLFHGLRWFQVGASGAITGMIGVIAVYAFTHSDALSEMIRFNLSRILIYLAIGLFIPGIDNAAHFGGMAAGAFLAWLMPDPVRPPGILAERLWRLAARALAAVCAAALAFTFVRWAVLA